VWHHGSGWGVFDGWGGWFWPHGSLFWLVIVGVIIAIVWFMRTSTTRSDVGDRGERNPSGLDVLDQRYARGEIGRDEYLQKRRDMAA
jgi:putative membrane protein